MTVITMMMIMFHIPNKLPTEHDTCDWPYMMFSRSLQNVCVTYLWQKHLCNMSVGSAFKDEPYTKQSCNLNILWNIKLNGCRWEQRLNMDAHQFCGGDIHCACKAETQYASLLTYKIEILYFKVLNFLTISEPLHARCCHPTEQQTNTNLQHYWHCCVDWQMYLTDSILCYFQEILVIISLSILLLQDLNYRCIYIDDKLLSLSNPLHTTHWLDLLGVFPMQSPQPKRLALW